MWLLHSALTQASHIHEGTPLFYKIHCLVQGVDATQKSKIEQGLSAFRKFSSVEFMDLEFEPRATLSIDMPLCDLSFEEWSNIYNDHFNIGFAVYNLKAWRVHNLEDQCVEFFTKGDISFLHPNTTTLLYHKNILELPYIYNANPHHNHPQ